MKIFENIFFFTLFNMIFMNFNRYNNNFGFNRYKKNHLYQNNSNNLKSKRNNNRNLRYSRKKVMTTKKQNIRITNKKIHKNNLNKINLGLEKDKKLRNFPKIENIVKNIIFPIPDKIEHKGNKNFLIFSTKKISDENFKEASRDFLKFDISFKIKIEKDK